MKIGDTYITLRFHGRNKWSRMKWHKRPYCRHFTWGRISLIFDQPSQREIEVCDYCLEAVKGMGEDGISVCEGCGIVEGYTHCINEEEYERGQS